MSIKISAIICTYNRAEYLPKAIKSIIKQTIDSKRYEIIVVDNKSTDNTKQIITENFTEVENLRYLYEPIQGLSQARNTGWKNAQGKYIAYLDDDAIASSQWLEKIIEAFETVTPQPGAVGGKVEPIWEIPQPEWLSDNFLLYLAIVNWSASPRVLNYPREILVGANIAFPKFLLEKVGGFNTNLGRKGNNNLSCEETFLFDKLMKINYDAYFQPDISVKHHIKAQRLNKRWFRDRFFWQGVSEAVVEIQLHSLSWQKRVSLAFQYSREYLKDYRLVLKSWLTSVDKIELTSESLLQNKWGKIIGLLGLYKTN